MLCGGFVLFFFSHSTFTPIIAMACHSALKDARPRLHCIFSNRFISRLISLMYTVSCLFFALCLFAAWPTFKCYCFRHGRRSTYLLTYLLTTYIWRNVLLRPTCAKEVTFYAAFTSLSLCLSASNFA